MYFDSNCYFKELFLPTVGRGSETQLQVDFFYNLAR